MIRQGGGECKIDLKACMQTVSQHSTPAATPIQMAMLYQLMCEVYIQPVMLF